MAWRTISAQQIAGRLTSSEQKMLAAVAGSPGQAAAKLAERLGDAGKEFLGAMRAVGMEVSTDGSVPDQLRRHVVARAVWDWVGQDFPTLKVIQTDARKQAAKEASDALEAIQDGTFGMIEPISGPDGSSSGGNWNSFNKVLGRMFPTPTPSAQAQYGQGIGYANPNAEEDVADSTSPGLPDEPKNVEALAGDGQVQLTWTESANAATYKVLRGVTAGMEDAVTPLASGLLVANYKDATAVNGTAYFYVVIAVGADPALLESGRSAEVTATPVAAV